MFKAPSTPPTEPEVMFVWSGKTQEGQRVRGRMRASDAVQVQTALRKQGIYVSTLTARPARTGPSIQLKDITLFTRQMATLLEAGVPLLQSFDIMSKGTEHLRLSRLLQQVRLDIESGSSLSQALRKHPQHFDPLYCNVVHAGETAGTLSTLLARLALSLEKTQSIQRKTQTLLIYPFCVVAMACVVVAIIMLWVIPAFADVFASLGADLPLITRMLLGMSHGLVQHIGWIAPALLFVIAAIFYLSKRSTAMVNTRDRLSLRLPVWRTLKQQACTARWARTLATMSGAGVPLVEALHCVSGVAGNHVYHQATQRIQHEVSTGSSLSAAMASTQTFPSMLVQMCAIGEASGTLEHMLSKSADFYEQAFDETVATLSSLIEPILIVFLGSIIGGIVVAVYLPVFKLGQIV